jgi:peptide/nickel transport system permease protein
VQQQLARRALLAIPVVLGVSVIVFMVMHLLPGDPVAVMLGGPEGGASPEAMQALREELGLNDPIYVQYARYLAQALRGNLGRSIRTHRPVTRYLSEQLPSTVELTLAGMALAIAIGIPAGCISAIRRGSWIDTATMAITMSSLAMPNFWLGLLLILVFVYTLRWFPVTSGSGVKALVLPVIVLGLRASANTARMTRSCMLEVLSQDYVRTARSKGLSEFAVVVRHALTNALIPVVTIIGLQVGDLLSGAVVVETVFARKGIGRLVVESVGNRDYPIVQGVVLLTAVVYVTLNFLVDTLYGYLDPRIRQQ